MQPGCWSEPTPDAMKNAMKGMYYEKHNNTVVAAAAAALSIFTRKQENPSLILGKPALVFTLLLLFERKNTNVGSEVKI